MNSIATGPTSYPPPAPEATTSGVPAHSPRPSVAVIGAGVSGLTAAYLLSRTHDVTLFEAEDRLGGHAHTHDVADSGGQRHAVDSGFIVHNDVTYPWLRKLFGELGVQVAPTEMSMSVRCDGCGLEYAGRPRPARHLRPATPPHRSAVRPDAVASRPVPPAGPGLAAHERGRGPHDLRRVPGARGVQRSLHRSLRRSGRLVRMVRRARDHAGLPGALSLPLPGQPRPAPGGRAPRSGTRSPAAHGATSSGWPGGYRMSARPMPSPTSPGTRTASRSGT